MRIGLTQRVEMLVDRNERRDSLDQGWAQLVFHSGCIPVPLPNQPYHARAIVDGLGLGGVILTGGNDLAVVPEARDSAADRDAFERELLNICQERRLPVLGVCRGMQMIVHYFGGQLASIENHVRKPHPVIPRQSPMPVHPRAEVNTFHSFGTRAELLPSDLMVAGMAPDGTVEAVCHRTLPIWGMMWHPERPIRPGGSRDERDADIIRALFGDKRS